MCFADASKEWRDDAILLLLFSTVASASRQLLEVKNVPGCLPEMVQQ